MRRILFPLRLWQSIKNPLFLYRHHQYIHALRVMLAVLFGFTINHFFAIKHGSWMLVTIVVLLGSVQHLGAVSKKTHQRIIGTLLGCLTGLLALSLYTISPWLCAAWMSLVVFFSAYYAIGKAGYAALTVGMTLVIVAGTGSASIEESLWRSANVILGAMITLIFASLLPIRAIDRWRFLLADNLRDAALMYSQIAQRHSLEMDAPLHRFNLRIIEMRSLMNSAALESQRSERDFEQIQRCQRTLYSLLERMCIIAETTPPLDDQGQQRIAIYRTLSRSARGIRFLQLELLDNQLLQPMSATPGACHWLTAELIQTTSRFCDELSLLMPALIRATAPISLWGRE